MHGWMWIDRRDTAIRVALTAFTVRVLAQQSRQRPRRLSSVPALFASSFLTFTCVRLFGKRLCLFLAGSQPTSTSCSDTVTVLFVFPFEDYLLYFAATSLELYIGRVFI